MPIAFTEMGEVLDSLKILPEAFTSDPNRLACFEREAKALASLNHPNIGAIYGLEKSCDTRALILELVEGPTQADRIKQGPIPQTRPDFPDCSLLLPLNSSEPPWYVTRMPGGVTGKAREGLRMSINTLFDIILAALEAGLVSTRMSYRMNVPTFLRHELAATDRAAENTTVGGIRGPQWVIRSVPDFGPSFALRRT